jgi:ABC-2 type transport system permease protein
MSTQTPMKALDTLFQSSKTLPFRVEMIRQVKRRRTLVAYLLMVALPLIVVAAVKLGPDSGDSGASTSGGGFGGGNLNLIGLATSSAWNFTIVLMLFGSGFLLTTVFALFHGDTIASEASWSTLRYLLAAPVPRRRLLLIKMLVALVLSLGSIVTLAVSSYLIGLAAFGGGDLASPLGGTFGNSDAFIRVSVITAYIFMTLLFVSGLAFLMSVTTDAPLGAVGTAVMISIVLQILNALEALGTIREYLPGWYADAWVGVLDPNISWGLMSRGVAYSIVAFAIFTAWAFFKFERKDIYT